MRRVKDNYAAIMATVAVVLALTGVGAQAAGVFVTSKQIRDGSILTQDIHKGAVQSTDVKNGTIDGADIGNGDVGPVDVTMPAPSEIQEAGAPTATPTMTYSKIDDVGAYTKIDPDSILQIDWTGSVEGHNGGEFSGCVFQIRIDGQSSPAGGGEVFGKGVVSVSASALFPGLAAGPHQVEIWAKLAAQEPGGVSDSCTVGPSAAGVTQTFVVSEQVV